MECSAVGYSQVAGSDPAHSLSNGPSRGPGSTVAGRSRVELIANQSVARAIGICTGTGGGFAEAMKFSLVQCWERKELILFIERREVRDEK